MSDIIMSFVYAVKIDWIGKSYISIIEILLNRIECLKKGWVVGLSKFIFEFMGELVSNCSILYHIINLSDTYLISGTGIIIMNWVLLSLFLGMIDTQITI